MDLLPATVYRSPPRQARGRQLNTIVEENEDTNIGTRSDSEGDWSDKTIVGRPAGWNPKLFVVAAAAAGPPRKQSRLATTVYAPSPVSSEDASPCSSNSNDGSLTRTDCISFQGSDNDTIFSDEVCPSLASDPTTFQTDSSRSSVVSNRSGRNRYPALLIPRTSWGSIEGPFKDLDLVMSPASRIRLSPGLLSKLPKHVPADDAPPSLGSNSSVTSGSPCVTNTSGPVTPDMRNIDVADTSPWGMPRSAHVDQPLEIALDDDHSILLSPAEAHEPQSAVLSALTSSREHEWGDIVISFPVPGSQPQTSLAQPSRRRTTARHSMPASEGGVELPSDALMTLQRLTRERSPETTSDCSLPSEEMLERSEACASRPRSLDGATPVSDHSFAKLSDYSFSQLSIPSPGGFFSSLKRGTRHTWCVGGSRTPSVPTSATAEKFYKCIWNQASEVKETVVTVDDTGSTEGPPTARQIISDKPENTADASRNIPTDAEDDDLYGAEEPTLVRQFNTIHEYEDAYEDELKQAAGANIDRTGSWLASQTSYLSALREANPRDEPVEFLGSPHPYLVDSINNSNDSPGMGTPQFNEFLQELEAANTQTRKSHQTSPGTPAGAKDPIFHVAFAHMLSNRRRRDAFLYASSRLEAVRSTRIATPKKHVKSLIGQHVLHSPERPKYTGPFNHNPRATGIFDRTTEQLLFERVERERRALESIKSSNWQIEALRTLFNGRLLASSEACDYLLHRATMSLSDSSSGPRKQSRILDFGGEATGSWAWHAAHEWPTTKVYTVLAKEQAQGQQPRGESKPQGPTNHRTITVPYLWQLPFRDKHFDVVSARGLYALLKSNPVPGVPEIDEWDLTVKECMRVLKPSGFLDFMIMDSTIARAGDRGEALSVEFGFELHRRGYEREAARNWLRRLKKEGFVDIKRAWMFLPMGRNNGLSPRRSSSEDFHPFLDGSQEYPAAPRPLSDVSIGKIIRQYMDVEAVQGYVGSTQDVADISGLLGVRMWEEWLVKIRKEAGWEESRLLDGIDEATEEGKIHGSGWKVLVGWAKKPPNSNAGQRGKKVLRRSEIQDALMDRKDEVGSPIMTPDSGRVETGVIPMIIQS